ncbi:MAG: hypothetical protein ACLFR0_08780 [Alphaproteobacteria bacterium]
MSFLDTLPAADRELLISLPYKVGVWLSHVDERGGEEADQEEKDALASIINGFTRDVFGSEVVQYIMTETLENKDKWKKWSEQCDNIHQECQRAIDILNEAVEEKEVSAFKRRLIEIAEAVALAFREYDDLKFITKLKIYLLYYKERYKAAKQNQSFKTLDQFLNISLKERRALYALAHTLDVYYS